MDFNLAFATFGGWMSLALITAALFVSRLVSFSDRENPYFLENG